MISVAKEVLEQRLDEYIQKVEEKGEELVVTQNEIPLVKIIPIKKSKSVKEVFADVQGTIKYHGDIMEPETDEWGDIS